MILDIFICALLAYVAWVTYQQHHTLKDMGRTLGAHSARLEIYKDRFEAHYRWILLIPAIADYIGFKKTEYPSQGVDEEVHDPKNREQSQL